MVYTPRIIYIITIIFLLNKNEFRFTTTANIKSMITPRQKKIKRTRYRFSTAETYRQLRNVWSNSAAGTHTMNP